MVFISRSIIFSARVLFLAIIPLSLLCTCSLQSLDRNQEALSPSLSEKIRMTLQGPMTRFPLQTREARDYTNALYSDIRSRRELIHFYGGIAGSEKVAKAILEAALAEDMDISLAFALAKAESDFKPRTQSRNRDDSVDRGLFQLNSRTFPALPENDAFDPAVNARKGLAHLRFCFNYGGDEIRALAVYNAGLSRAERGTIPASTYAYIERVLRYDAEIDGLFRAEFLPLWIPLSDLPSQA
jgi:soluble lytic murein transglycosylase-like protein